jgi:hypothetical protein
MRQSQMTLNNVFVAYSCRLFDYEVIGVYSTYDLAMAALHRRMNSTGAFNDFVWNPDVKKYENPKDDSYLYFVHKTKLDEVRDE